MRLSHRAAVLAAVLTLGAAGNGQAPAAAAPAQTAALQIIFDVCKSTTTY